MIKIYITKDVSMDTIILLKQLYSNQIKVCVQFQSDQEMLEYSKIIWNNRTFLPHATEHDLLPANMSANEWQVRQSIYLTHKHNNPNHAIALMYVDNLPVETSGIEVQYIIVICQEQNIALINQIKSKWQNYELYHKNNTTWQKI